MPGLRHVVPRDDEIESFSYRGMSFWHPPKSDTETLNRRLVQVLCYRFVSDLLGCEWLDLVFLDSTIPDMDILMQTPVNIVVNLAVEYESCHAALSIKSTPRRYL